MARNKKKRARAAAEDADDDENFTAAELSSGLVTFMYLASTFFQADLTGALATLSRIFQADLLESSHTTVMEKIDGFLLYLKTHYLTDGNIIWGEEMKSYSACWTVARHPWRMLPMTTRPSSRSASASAR